MKKLIVFIGEGGSGKTTLIKKLLKEYPEIFKKIVTYTSRAPRTWDGEVNGVDYFFLPEDQFSDDYEFVVKKRTTDGFHYAVRRSDLFPSTHHLLLTLREEGVKKLSDLNFGNFIVVRILISDELKAERMRKRGDPENMIEERLRIERESRVSVDMGTLFVIELDAAQKLADKIMTILNFLDL